VSGKICKGLDETRQRVVVDSWGHAFLSTCTTRLSFHLYLWLDHLYPKHSTRPGLTARRLRIYPLQQLSYDLTTLVHQQFSIPQ